MEAFSNFKVPTAGGIVGQVDSWVGGLSIFGSKIGDNQEALPSSITCCVLTVICVKIPRHIINR